MRYGVCLASALLLSAQAVLASEDAYRFVVSEEQVDPSPAVVRGYVVAWINCFECTNGELNRVLKSGALAVPFLQEVVSEDSTYFPDRTSEFEQQWEDLDDYIDLDSTFEFSLPKASFVNLQEEAIRSSYVARAKKALELLGVPP